jgi:hypothetical protein
VTVQLVANATKFEGLVATVCSLASALAPASAACPAIPRAIRLEREAPEAPGFSHGTLPLGSRTTGRGTTMRPGLVKKVAGSVGIAALVTAAASGVGAC